MCYSAKANCWTKRGDYSAIDCNGNLVQVDWDVTPKGTNKTCIYSGCNQPLNQRLFNSSWIKPLPVCDWRGLNVTIQAYSPGTNILLDSYVTRIDDCFKVPFRKDQTTDEPSFSIQILDNQVGGDKKIKLELAKEQELSVVAIHLVTGKEFELQGNTLQPAGTMTLDFPEGNLEQGALYLIVVKSDKQILGKTKLINL